MPPIDVALTIHVIVLQGISGEFAENASKKARRSGLLSLE
jgi:hypothetical protein